MFDLLALITAAGYFGLFAIVFAESGLFFGFFLPGDSLLFTAGFVASQGSLNIVILMTSLFVAATLGDSVGYAFGRRVGPKIFTREESRFFKPAHIIRAHNFFLKYGKKAIFLARFLPIVRTFVPIVAGVAEMPYREFIVYNIIGGASWVGSMLLTGYFLGSLIPDAEKYLHVIVLIIIGVSFLPMVYEFIKARKERRAL
jgi:membrane-associated protein